MTLCYLSLVFGDGYLGVSPASRSALFHDPKRDLNATVVGSRLLDEAKG